MQKQSRLKFYFGPSDEAQAKKTSSNVGVSMPTGTKKIQLSELLAPLSDAVDSNRAWLNDFRDEELAISRDLYDVLLAYRKIRKSA